MAPRIVRQAAWILMAVGAALLAPSAGAGPAMPQIFPPDCVRVAADHGIEIVGVRLSAAGYMLNFRYKVRDAEKATAILDHRKRSFLVDQESGAKLIVPAPAKVGPLRQVAAQPIPGRTYFTLFANPGRFIKAGSKVTVVIGEMELRDLVVGG